MVQAVYQVAAGEGGRQGQVHAVQLTFARPSHLLRLSHICTQTSSAALLQICIGSNMIVCLAPHLLLVPCRSTLGQT
jgi:hypothetical protein